MIALQYMQKFGTLKYTHELTVLLWKVKWSLFCGE